MDPPRTMEGLFDGISQGTLDWINDTFAAIHGNDDRSTRSSIVLEEENSNLPGSAAEDIASLNRQLRSSTIRAHQQGDFDSERFLEPSFELEHDALRLALAQNATNQPSQPPRYRRSSPSRNTHHVRRSSYEDAELPPTVPPTPSPTSEPSPPSPTDAHTGKGRIHLPRDGLYRTNTGQHTHQQEHQQVDQALSSASAQDYASHARLPTLPTPTSLLSSNSLIPSSNTPPISMNERIPTEPLQPRFVPSQTRRRTDPAPYNQASYTQLVRPYTTPIPPIDTKRPYPSVGQINQSSLGVDEHHRSLEPLVISNYDAYSFSNQPPFSHSAASYTSPDTQISGAASPTCIKKEPPPEQITLQSVFHSSSDIIPPTRTNLREKNRVAAIKSRSKKRDLAENLALQSREYSATNKRLKDQVGMLREEVKGLRDTVRRHSQCGGWTGDMAKGVEVYLSKLDEQDLKDGQAMREEAMERKEGDVIWDTDVVREEAGGKG